MPAPDQNAIFITGAASGIGRAVALLFAERGWFAGLADVNEAGLAETARMLPAGASMATRLDVRDRRSWRAALDAFAAATGGRMRVLFNNAGIARGGWFEDVAPEEAEHVISVNLIGAINGIYCALPLLKATPGARIVNTSSVAGVYGAPRLAVYSATKFAVRALTEALDLEFARHGVRVTSLMPWFIETPLLDTTTGDANMSARESLRAADIPIYPVRLAAERAWDAAHGKDLHYPVGAEAERARFAARFAPALFRARLRKNLMWS